MPIAFRTIMAFRIGGPLLMSVGTAAGLLENQDVQRAYLGKDYVRINE